MTACMRSFLLPVIFLKFWYIEAPLGMLGFFTSLNTAFFELFSLPLMLRTFFKPLKNEYRQGLVWFSRWMGMLTKSFLILFDLAIFIVMMAIEAVILIGFILLPFAGLLVLFIK